ncbi:MAG TPA: 4-alpha-glucanotransferase, partial [Candidatus Binatia bacterium]|nr:4-alpha-glucanotransferase [Candidatus Binatia bacterium]
GIGEIGDLPALCRWLASAGHRLLQLLPIFEMPVGERSPYAAVSAFAIDPIYLSLDAVEDVVATGGRDAARDAIAAARGDSAIDYDGVRRAKRAALERAFARFVAAEWETGSARAVVFRRFRDDEAVWLADYALFRALQERHGSWTGWEPGLRDRRPEAIAAEASGLARERLFHEWVQWIAAVQWTAARRAAAAEGVRLKGDLPFMVSASSADVWARQGDFALDAEIGAPPDAFNADGQRWGLPPCRWEAMAAAGDLAWLRARARRAAELFDAFRIDHVVGFYRQYVLPPGRFVPADETEQIGLGERLLRVLRESAGPTKVIGEDLGVVPPFVRASLARLAIPGYRVLRWEDDAGIFRDPTAYPARSVATSGTHDTSTLAAWWEDELDDAGRRALARVPAFAPLAGASAKFTPPVHAALLDGLYAAASDLVVLPFPDVYGGRERINVPATVGRTNWAYRLPWTVEELGAGAADELRTKLRTLAERHGRM